MTIKLKNNRNQTEHICRYAPLGLDQLKFSWQFSEEPPFGLNSAISTDTLTFIKEDAAFIRGEFSAMGTGASIDIMTDNFTFALDFTAYIDNGYNLEVGVKATSLKDDIERVKTLTTSPNDLTAFSVNKQWRQSKSVAGSYANVYWHTKTDTNSRFQFITDPTITGEEQGSCYSVGIKRVEYRDQISDTGCVTLLNTEHSLLTYSLGLGDANESNATHSFSISVEVLELWRLLDAMPNVAISCQIRRGYEFWNNGEHWFTPITRVADPMTRNLDQDHTQRVTFNFNITDQPRQCTDYNAFLGVQSGDVTNVYVHYFCEFFFGGNAITEDTSVFTFRITSAKITTDLPRIRQNFSGVSLWALLRQMAQYNLLPNDSEEYGEYPLLNGYRIPRQRLKITSADLAHGNVQKIDVDITDLMRCLSLNFGWLWIEEGNRYHIRDARTYFARCKSEAYRIDTTRAKDIKIINQVNYSKVEIGQDTDFLEHSPFCKCYYSPDFGNEGISARNSIAESYKVESANITTAGDVIMQKLTDGTNNDGNLMLIATEFESTNEPTLPMNMLFSNARVVNRLSPFLFSYMPATQTQALVGVGTNTMNNCQLINESQAVNEEVVQGSGIFHSYYVEINVCFTDKEIADFLAKCRAIRIDGDYYFPIVAEFNIEPNISYMKCLKYK